MPAIKKQISKMSWKFCFLIYCGKTMDPNAPVTTGIADKNPAVA